MPALATKEAAEISLQKICDDAALELRRITEKADFALSVVTQAIRTQESIAKGKVLIGLQEQLPNGEWLDFLKREDVGFSHQMANHYMNAARLFEDAAPLYGEELLLNHGVQALAQIHTLPTDVKLELLDQVEETGRPLGQKEVAEVKARTATKLSKTAELLAEAKAKKHDLKEQLDNPELKGRERSAVATANRDADRAIETYENRIKQLEAELEREKEHKTELSDGLNEAEDNLSQANRKLEQAQKELAAALEEAHNLRFDGDTARSQRVSRVGNALILALPQTLSDVQKYIAEKEHFSEKVQQAVEGQVRTLMSYLQEHFTYAENEEA